jgi:signal transduction histidine kinase
VILLDRDAAVAQINPCACKLLSCDDSPRADQSGQTVFELPESLSEQLKEVIDSGNARELDGSVIFKGAAERFRLFAWPVNDPTTSIGCMLIIEDRSEVVELQKQLADADRLVALGNLASRVAHELNNPLDGILRYVNLAMRTIREQGLDKPYEYLEQSRRGLMRMVQIVSELLEFSRRTYASLETTSVEKTADEALRTLESTIEAQGVRLTRAYSQVPAQVRSRNLFQVFCNIIKNALDAMPDGGELTVSIDVTDGMVAIRFRDTGSGFSPVDSETMFEPFYTTKGQGKGTGLGLAICKDIIEREGGRITAENAEGGGSIFTVWLPDRSDLKTRL